MRTATTQLIQHGYSDSYNWSHAPAAASPTLHQPIDPARSIRDADPLFDALGAGPDAVIDPDAEAEEIPDGEATLLFCGG